MIGAVTAGACSTILNPLCHAASGVGSDLLGAGANAVLTSISSWVVSGATWLLEQIGGVMNSSTSVDIGASWFHSHYVVMLDLAGTIVLPLLLFTVVQSVVRQDPSILLRSFLIQLPLAGLLSVVAIELVSMALVATDAMSSTVSAGSGAAISHALSGLAKVMITQASVGTQTIPAFVLLLGGLLVTLGAFSLWLELLVRSAAISIAVLFLPLALASLVWPAISHWCRRLVETLVALILSKFVIIAILSLAVSALSSGTASGFSGILSGGTILLLAAFTPFALLKLIPIAEAGVAHQLEGARSRLHQSVTSAPRSAASFALRAASSAGGGFDPGLPGTGIAEDFGVPGPTNDLGFFGDDGEGGTREEGPVIMGPHGLPYWRCVPEDGSQASTNSSSGDDAGVRSPPQRGPYPYWGGPTTSDQLTEHLVWPGTTRPLEGRVPGSFGADDEEPEEWVPTWDENDGHC